MLSLCLELTGFDLKLRSQPLEVTIGDRVDGPPRGKKRAVRVESALTKICGEYPVLVFRLRVCRPIPWTFGAHRKNFRAKHLPVITSQPAVGGKTYPIHHILVLFQLSAAPVIFGLSVWSILIAPCPTLPHALRLGTICWESMATSHRKPDGTGDREGCSPRELVRPAGTAALLVPGATRRYPAPSSVEMSRRRNWVESDGRNRGLRREKGGGELVAGMPLALHADEQERLRLAR